MSRMHYASMQSVVLVGTIITKTLEIDWAVDLPHLLKALQKIVDSGRVDIVKKDAKFRFQTNPTTYLIVTGCVDKEGRIRRI